MSMTVRQAMDDFLVDYGGSGVVLEDGCEVHHGYTSRPAHTVEGHLREALGGKANSRVARVAELPATFGGFSERRECARYPDRVVWANGHDLVVVAWEDHHVTTWFCPDENSFHDRLDELAHVETVGAAG